MNKTAVQNWLPFEPSLEEINDELRSMRQCYDYDDASFRDTTDYHEGLVRKTRVFQAADYLEGNFHVKSVADLHPESCKPRSDEAKVETLRKLTLEDPQKVLREFANTLSHTGLFRMQVVLALTTIGYQNSQDEATWHAFNGKLREFMDMVGTSSSNALSTHDYTRLRSIGFTQPKTARLIAKDIGAYLSQVEDGTISPFAP